MLYMVEGYRVAFVDIKDGYAKFTLYEDEEVLANFDYPIDELPEGVKKDHLDEQFKPEFDDDGEIVALRHDQELTEQKYEEYEEAYKRFEERRENN